MLKGPKPKPQGYPKELRRIGDHIRKRRMDLGLLRRELAWELGTHNSTIANWECSRSIPDLRALPKVVKFLGYGPFPPDHSIGKRLRRHREALCLSQSEAVKLMGVEQWTVSKWEAREDHKQNDSSIARILQFMRYNPVCEQVSVDERTAESP